MNLPISWLRACSVSVVSMLPITALAIDVVGPITVDTAWITKDSPYVIQSNVSVDATATLTIAPGVTVQFAGPYTLTVNGTLIAQGLADKQIIFTAQSDLVVPGNIMFTGGAAVFSDNAYQSGSILENVLVEKLGSVDTPGAVVLNGAQPYIHNSSFRNNRASAIYAYSIDGDLRIENNLIEFNTAQLGAGVFATAPMGVGGKLSLRGNSVRNNTAAANGGGMYFTGVKGVGDGVISLSGDNVEANNAMEGGGIYTYNVVINLAGETVRDNHTASGDGGGINFHDSQANMSNSMILRNHAAGMGGGIFLNAGTYNFTDNVLALNESGVHGGGIDMHALPTVIIDHSVVAGNKANVYGAGVSMTDGVCTLTNSAIVSNESVNAIGIFVGANLQNNTIAYNAFEYTSEGYFPQYFGSSIAVGHSVNERLAINDNNIFRNSTPYDVFTSYAGDVNAQSNWWGTTDATVIAGRIKLVAGSINTNGLLFGPNLAAPISPPSNVSVIPTATTIKLQWDVNPESDTRGYKVYWGSKTFPDYEGTMDVGNTTSFEIQNLTPAQIASLVGGSGFVAVTAYDESYLLANDDAATPVNENQTQGHESWYAVPSSTISITAKDAQHKKTGELVNFSIKVTNSGPSVGEGEFIITHTLLSGLAYHLLSTGQPEYPQVSGCSLSADKLQITCTHPAIAANASVELIFRAEVTADTLSEVVSTAEVRPIDFATNPAYSRAQVSLHVNAPDVGVTWSGPSEPTVGSFDNYIVIAKNYGPATAYGVKLDISIPANFTLNTVDASCTQVTGSSQITCALGDISSLQQVAITLGLTANTQGKAMLMADTDTGDDSTPSNNFEHFDVTIKEPVVVQGGGDQGNTSGSSTTSKKGGGGGIDLTGLLMLWALLVTHRRYRRYSAV